MVSGYGMFLIKEIIFLQGTVYVVPDKTSTVISLSVDIKEDLPAFAVGSSKHTCPVDDMESSNYHLQ